MSTLLMSARTKYPPFGIQSDQLKLAARSYCMSKFLPLVNFVASSDKYVLSGLEISSMLLAAAFSTGL